MSKIKSTFAIFCIWLYIAIYSILIFVSNGDTLDWRGLNCEQMMERIIPKAKSGDIILFHNDIAHTEKSLDCILSNLEKKGFLLVFTFASAILLYSLSVNKPKYYYFVSLCVVCFLQNLQYLFISSLSGSFFLFFIVL